MILGVEVEVERVRAVSLPSDHLHVLDDGDDVVLLHRRQDARHHGAARLRPSLRSARSGTRGGLCSPLWDLLGHVVGRLPAHLQSGAALVPVLDVPGVVPHVLELRQGHGVHLGRRLISHRLGLMINVMTVSLQPFGSRREWIRLVINKVYHLNNSDINRKRTQ